MGANVQPRLPLPLAASRATPVFTQERGAGQPWVENGVLHAPGREGAFLSAGCSW